MTTTSVLIMKKESTHKSALFGYSTSVEKLLSLPESYFSFELQEDVKERVLIASTDNASVIFTHRGNNKSDMVEMIKKYRFGIMPHSRSYQQNKLKGKDLSQMIFTHVTEHGKYYQYLIREMKNGKFEIYDLTKMKLDTIFDHIDDVVEFFKKF